METKKRVRDKRKILLVLPLMLLPFLALAFYALGGGRATQEDVEMARGINTELPDASFKTNDPLDKMGFYAKAGNDSVSDTLATGDRLRFSLNEDPNTAQINEKLAALNREINSPVPSSAEVKIRSLEETGGSAMKNDVDRLELLMKSMQQDKQRDPEIEQMNSLLDKILDIQNPERVQQKNEGKSSSGAGESRFSAIAAMIAGNQKVMQGGSVKLKLLDSVLLGGVMVPKGHLLFGLCRIVNQRLLLDIKNVRLGSLIIPVNLSVYALDGMTGIDAPDAVLAGAAGMGAQDAIGGIQVYGLEGIGGQAASAGIDATKSLLSKRARMVKVKLKDGLSVLLRDNDRK